MSDLTAIFEEKVIHCAASQNYEKFINLSSSIFHAALSTNPH